MTSATTVRLRILVGLACGSWACTGTIAPSSDGEDTNAASSVSSSLSSSGPGATGKTRHHRGGTGGGAGASGSGGVGGSSGTGGSAGTNGGGGSGGSAGAGGSGGTGGGGGSGGSAGAGGSGGTGGGGGTGGSSSGALLFVGDFESGDLSQWAYVERCAADRIVVYSAPNLPVGAPTPRQGSYAALFHVLDTDVAPCTSTSSPRAELETDEGLLHPGDDVWEAWSMYLPSTHPNCIDCTGWFSFQEDYGAPWDGSPEIGWYIDFSTQPNKLVIGRGAQYGHDTPWRGTLTTNKWIDFLVHKKFSNVDDGSGFIEAWVDGIPVTFPSCNCTKLSTQTMHSTQPSVGFYLNSYRAAGLFASLDVFFDGVRIGTTRDVVELK